MAAWIAAVLMQVQDPLDLHRRVYERVAPAVVAVSPNGRTLWSSGTIITEDGYVLVHQAAVGGASRTRLFVRFMGLERQEEARVVFWNPSEPWALLKLPGRRYPFVPLAEGGPPALGTVVYALGDSFGSLSLDGRPAIMMGIVSDRYGLESAGEVLETTAAVNPGQEGGPLVNAQGELVGITITEYHPARYAGTALPMARYAARVREAIERDRRSGVASEDVQRWFGWDLEERDGRLVVSRVYAQGPAARAGVREGDMVVRVRSGGRVGLTVGAQREILDGARAREEVEVTLRRGGEEVVVRMTPEEVVFY